MKKYILPLSFFLILNFCLSAVEILWQFKVDSGSLQIGQAPNGNIIVSGENRISAFNPDNGQVIWQKSLGDEDSQIPSIGQNNVCYVWYYHAGNLSKRLVALDVNTGDELWSHDSGTTNLGNLVVAEQKVFYVERSTEQLHALDGDDGSTLWTYSSQTEIQNNLSYIGGKLYTTELEDTWWGIIAVDAQLGTKTMTISKPPKDNQLWRNGIITGLDQDKFLADTNLGFYYVLDHDTGDWSVTYSGHSGWPLVDTKGIVYEDDGSVLIAVDGNTGAEIWRFELGDTSGEMRPLAVTSDGVVYCAVVQGQTRDDHDLYAINPSNLSVKYTSGNPTYFAKLEWSLPIHAAIMIVGDNANLYVGATDGTLYCIKGSALTGNAPWPMYYGNAQNTFSKPEPLPNDGFLKGYNWMGDFPWIYNQSTDTWFRMASSNDQFWLYNYSTHKWSDYSENPTQLGWAWMEYFPWIYNVADSTWYYLHQEESPYFLYNETTEEWLPLTTD